MQAKANRNLVTSEGPSFAPGDEEATHAGRDAAPDPPTAPAKGFSFAGLIAGALVLALVGWIGVSVKAATHKQAQLAAERQRTAAAAALKGTTSAPVATVRGVPDSWLPSVPIDGTLAAVQESDLGFKAPGRLAAIRVHIGQHVDKGDVLATLDATEAQASLQAADAQVKVAEAQLALASDSERRTSSLVGSGAAAQASGVQVTQQRSLAAAQVEAAKAQRALAAASLANCTLVAPFSGTVTKVPAGPGGNVSPAVPLFHLQDTSRLKLVATVGEGDAPLVRAAAGVTVRAGGRTIHGKIVAVLGSVDAMTRRVPVEAQIENPLDRGDKASAAGRAEPLLAGIFVRGSAESGERVEVLRLPATALRPGSQDEVMVVMAGKLVARQVVFSMAADGSLLVRSGLQASDTVLAAPSAEAKAGDAVETMPAPVTP